MERARAVTDGSGDGSSSKFSVKGSNNQKGESNLFSKASVAQIHPQSSMDRRSAPFLTGVSSRRVASTLRRSVQPRSRRSRASGSGPEGVADDLIMLRQKFEACRAQFKDIAETFHQEYLHCREQGRSDLNKSCCGKSSRV